MCDKEFYILRLKCENCDHEWEQNIPFGKVFFGYSVGFLSEGDAYYARWSTSPAEKVNCPNCGTGRIVKAATCEMQVDHARESWPVCGSQHGILQVNEDNPVMAERWRQAYVNDDLENNYAYEIMTRIEGCNEYREVCSIKGRHGAGLDIANAIVAMRPIVEAIVHLEKTIGTDERLFVSAMSKLRGLLLSSGLAKVKEQGKCNPTQK